jgi:hypothetical protein
MTAVAPIGSIVPPMPALAVIVCVTAKATSGERIKNSTAKRYAIFCAIKLFTTDLVEAIMCMVRFFIKDKDENRNSRVSSLWDDKICNCNVKRTQEN